jgi:hypothetical protein
VAGGCLSSVSNYTIDSEQPTHLVCDSDNLQAYILIPPPQRTQYLESGSDRDRYNLQPKSEHKDNKKKNTSDPDHLTFDSILWYFKIYPAVGILV